MPYFFHPVICPCFFILSISIASASTVPPYCESNIRTHTPPNNIRTTALERSDPAPPFPRESTSKVLPKVKDSHLVPVPGFTSRSSLSSSPGNDSHRYTSERNHLGYSTSREMVSNSGEFVSTDGK